MIADHEIDAAVAEVDVDAAFDAVVGRAEAEQRRHRFQRVLVAAACILAVVGVAWFAWPADDDQSQRVDQVGEPLPPVDTEQTPASATGITETGLRVTVSVADDVIPVGGSTGVEVTVTNESDETFNGGWEHPFQCGQNVTTLVITSPEGAAIDGLDDASGWDGPTEPIGPVVLTEDAVAWRRWPSERPASLGPHACTGQLDLDPLDPGQSVTASGTWDAWFTPGALPNDGQLMVTVNAASVNCLGDGGGEGDDEHRGRACAIDAGATVQVDVPITIDDSARPAPPSGTALAAATGRADVQAIIEGMDPASPYQPSFSASLVQVGQLWLLSVQRSTAAHVWFNGDFVLDVQAKQTGDPFTPPDVGPAEPVPSTVVDPPTGPIDTEQTPASATGVSETGLRVTVSVADDVIPVGGSTTVEVTVTNESDESFLGAWAQPFECGENVTTHVVTSSDGTTIADQEDDPDWRGPSESIGPVVLTDRAEAWADAPTDLPTAVGPQACRGMPHVTRLDPGASVTTSGTWNAWFSPGSLPNDGRLMVTVSATSGICAPDALCEVLAGTYVDVGVPFAVDDRMRTGPPSSEALEAATDRDDLEAIMADITVRLPAGPVDVPVYAAGLVQVEQQWLLSLQSGSVAAHIWFDGDAVLDVQRKESQDPITPP